MVTFRMITTNSNATHITLYWGIFSVKPATSSYGFIVNQWLIECVLHVIIYIFTQIESSACTSERLSILNQGNANSWFLFLFFAIIFIFFYTTILRFFNRCNNYIKKQLAGINNQLCFSHLSRSPLYKNPLSVN